ncbi:putative alpha-L-fucosidase [Anopheles merus]|uniref:putative alpha-L-fucosidase n=1 Tax=Anopheles merus TaxID=30066 RepID=UPI001BE472FA|nr:putative alpha-L-fucosidase [Anopheles merus]
MRSVRTSVWLCSAVVVLGVLCLGCAAGKYEPTWESLDSRPLPKWYDDAKVGIFIHWGVYAVPSYGSEWFWINWQGSRTEEYVQFMANNYKPGFTYQDFASDFTAELFNATEWAELFARSGARYVVLTSKHHEGYTLWPSKHTFGWNAMDVGPHRDVLGELANAVRATGQLTFGVYYSLFEWFNRLYLNDKLHVFMQREYVDGKVWPELQELVNTYRPEVLWSDGDWEAPDGYWKAKEFFAWLYNESPVRDTIVTNDRWGMGTLCLHGDFHTCSDRYNPGVLQKHKWENAMTIDRKSWGHRVNARLEDFMTTDELIGELVTTVSCGGNILINVGPTKAGTIEAIFAERLVEMGRWLKVNGPAIYKSQPWQYQNDTLTGSVWYTTTKGSSHRRSNFRTIFATVLDYPYKTNSVRLGAFSNQVTNIAQITMLGYNTALKWKPTEDGIMVEFPPKNEIDRLELKHAWTLKITLTTQWPLNV